MKTYRPAKAVNGPLLLGPYWIVETDEKGRNEVMRWKLTPEDCQSECDRLNEEENKNDNR